MARVRIGSVIDAPPEEVFSLYMDTDRRSEWNPTARGLREQSGPVNEAGSTYVMDTRFGNFEVHLLRVEAPHLVELLEGISSRPKAHVLLRFDPLPDGRTRLTAESTFEPRGTLGRVTASVNAVAAALYGRIELRRLKAAAERAISHRHAAG